MLRGAARGLATVAENTCARSHCPAPRRKISSARRRPACARRRRISCTFVLQKQKQRVTVPARVGWTLLQTAKHHKLPVNGTTADGSWDYITFGEGPGSIEDHVVVAKEFYALTGPPGEQEGTLLRVSEPNATETSRLAACIKLTKEMDGLTVLVPETNADLTNLL